MMAWGRSLATAMNLGKDIRETPLMRMFRIEYAKEYRQMKRLGYEMDDSTIRAFIDSNRI